MSVGSEPATSGSVIAKHERTTPSQSGRRYFSFCASVAQWSSVCMLPSSGAWAFSANGPKPDFAASADTAAMATCPEPHAAVLLRHVRQPQAPVLGRDAHLDDRLDEEAAVALAFGDPRLGGSHDLGDEVAHLQAQRVDLGGEAEVDGHGVV